MKKRLRFKKTSAFTLLEVMIVVGSIAILSAVGAIAYRDYDRRVNLDVSAQEIINTLRKAQNQSVTSKTASQYGVYFDESENKYYLFEGETWASRNPGNVETFLIPSAIEMYDVSFAETSDEVIFRKLVGTTPNYGSLKIRVKTNHAQFKVISVNPEGRVSEDEINTSVPPTSFSLNSPFVGSNETSTLNPSFDWEDSSGSNITYTLWISTDPNYSTKTEIQNILNSNYTLQSGEEIINQARNYWKVKAVNDAGVETWSNEGNWFMDVDVSNPPDDFSLISPVDGYNEISTLTPSFDWEDSVDPDGDSITYTLQHSTDPDFNTKTEITQISASEYSLKSTEALVADAENYWRVYAVDSNGAYKLCSEGVWSIFTGINFAPNPFSLILPTNGQIINNTVPSFDWEDSSDNDQGDSVTFTLWYSADPTFTSKTEVAGLTSSTYQVPVENRIEDHTVYFWKVKAIDNHGAEKWSNQQDWSFEANEYEVYCQNETISDYRVIEGAKFVFDNCTFTNNIKIVNSDVKFVGGVLTGNTKEYESSKVQMIGTTIDKNLTVRSGSELILDGGTLNGNFIVSASVLSIINGAYVNKSVDVNNGIATIVTDSNIGQNLAVSGGTLVVTGNTIGSNLSAPCPTQVLEAGDNIVGGSTTLCGL